jgi:Ras-related protein Rab-1A
MEQKPLVQWSFLQYKKTLKGGSTPAPCFLHSCTQIGSKLLIYGGANAYGEALDQLFLYDTTTFLWSCPSDAAEYQEDHPGGRYGHIATLVEMHPPKMMIYGGMISGKTFEFDAPDSAADESRGRSFMAHRRRAAGRNKGNLEEEVDENVYFLTLNADKWMWSKPLLNSSKDSRPMARSEHTACRTGTNEVTIFGGWGHGQALNDMWSFNVVDMEWKSLVTSGIQPRPRYRHTMEVIGNKMFVLGGVDNGDDLAEACASNIAFHVLDLATLQWSHPSIRGINPFPRSGHASAVIGAKTIAIFGGKFNATTFFNDLLLLDTETHNCVAVRAVESHLPIPVANTSLNAIGNKIFVFGGTDVKDSAFHDLRSLDIGYYLSADDLTVGQGASSDYAFKILIIGDAAVGKSSILTRFSENVFMKNYASTVGIDFNSRMIRVDQSICKLEIWDTAGQERFSTITASYYRGAQGCVLVYDVSSRDSFEHVSKWYDRARQLGGEDLITILVGNKIDLPDHERQVTTQEGELYARELNIPFLETSALSGSNVESVFVTMTRDIKKLVDSRGLSGIKGKNLKQAGGVTLANREQGGRSSCGCS